MILVGTLTYFYSIFFWLLDKPPQIRYTNTCILRWMQIVLFYVRKFPRSRGDSGALYLQSATAGVMAR